MERTIDDVLDDLLERLASLEHERWGHWQAYVHAQGEKNDDGSITLPAASVARWENQMATPYGDLSEPEKESDREQVMRYLPLIKDALNRTV